MPRSFHSSAVKPLSNFSIDTQWVARDWPVCAAVGHICRCPRGTAAIFDSYDDDVYQIASRSGSVRCVPTLPAFTASGETFSNRIKSPNFVYCRCGQPLEPEEQWSTFTDNCLQVGSHYRTGNGVAVASSCMGEPVDYSMSRPNGGEFLK